jgi:methanogenesis imperfect marker protein 11
MENISEPYLIRYLQLVGIGNESGDRVELIEFFECTGGAMWAMHHYPKSPVVESVRIVGATMRYLLRCGDVPLHLEGSRFPAGISGAGIENNEIRIRYIGMGGGGVGAAACRAFAGGVKRCEADPAGGGRLAGSTVWLPYRSRVLIGIDDTDTPEDGATWTLAHNIAKAVEDERSRYLSHTIVQLYPVPYRTKNCVSLVVEFASSEPQVLAGRFQRYLERYTLSEKTGMAVFTGFDPGPLLAFGEQVKRGEVSIESLPRCPGLDLLMEGRGIVGAVAAIPFATRYKEALELWNGQH